jgi:hypothetical protein
MQGSERLTSIASALRECSSVSRVYTIQPVYDWNSKVESERHKKSPIEIYPLSFLSVGKTGFEPATTRPPALCATGLRYFPNYFGVAKIT